jgi:HD-like signal output (HDOD) protein
VGSGSIGELEFFFPQQAGRALTVKTNELNDILQTLDALQNRVKEITGEETGHGPVPANVEVAESETVVEPAPRDSQNYSLPIPDAASMGTLRHGMVELTAFTKLKDFPEYFGKLAEKTGLRMVLLKRWTSGLQVFMEKNIKLPADAKRKGRDGRAPIPSGKGDIFQAIGDEAAVYSGPVPVKHFPLDLTLMLGRGSTDRKIIILPLPSQNHWNTFLYLDADEASIDSLAVAEVLAHFALARMCLLNKGVRSHTGRVNAILQSEIFRRDKIKNTKKGRPALTPAAIDSTFAATDQTDEIPNKDNSNEQLQYVTPPKVGPVLEEPVTELDPFEVSESLAEPETEVKPIPLNPSSQPAGEVGHDIEEISGNQNLTPELILNQSGELPALPKAACHIMAVIEDPKTTATRLEKALAMDQTLTAKVLRIANSPFYGAVREIRTVSEAIVRLGFVTIRNWTVVTATKSVFLAPGAGALYQKIWRQSVLSAMASQLVGQALGTREPEGLFIGGLMQNIGQLVLARSHPQLFQEILVESETSGKAYHEVENKLLGFDHGALGALLIQDWNLSEELEQAVRWHHSFEENDAQQSRLAAMIALGEEIAFCTGSGQTQESDQDQSTETDTDEVEQLSRAALYLGVTPSQFGDLKNQAAQLHIDPHFFS